MTIPDPIKERIAAIRNDLEGNSLETSEAEDLVWALAELEVVRVQLVATVKAKQENDERFMLERDQARIELGKLVKRIEHVKGLTRLKNRPHDTKREIAFANGANAMLDDVKNILEGKQLL